MCSLSLSSRTHVHIILLPFLSINLSGLKVVPDSDDIKTTAEDKDRNLAVYTKCFPAPRDRLVESVRISLGYVSDNQWKRLIYLTRYSVGTQIVIRGIINQPKKRPDYTFVMGVTSSVILSLLADLVPVFWLPPRHLRFFAERSCNRGHQIGSRP